MYTGIVTVLLGFRSYCELRDLMGWLIALDFLLCSLYIQNQRVLRGLAV